MSLGYQIDIQGLKLTVFQITQTIIYFDLYGGNIVHSDNTRGEGMVFATYYHCDLRNIIILNFKVYHCKNEFSLSTTSVVAEQPETGKGLAAP